MEAGESKSFAGVALTEGANYVDIHTDGTCNLSGSLTYAFATAPAAQQTRTAVKINPQSADIYAEGIPATFPSEDGKTVYTMQLTFLATEHPVGDAEWETLRAQILSGDETGLLESHIDTYRFRFSGGEPYFLEHNELMICR